MYKIRKGEAGELVSSFITLTAAVATARAVRAQWGRDCSVWSDDKDLMESPTPDEVRCLYIDDKGYEYFNPNYRGLQHG